MIKAIIFDCFGVLYVHTGPEFIKNNAANYEKVKDKLLDASNQTDYGLISHAEYEQLVSDITGIPLAEIHAHAFKGFGRNTDLITFIETDLRPHYKVGLLSNISADSMEAFFTKLERASLFDAAVLSSEAGIIKPNPAAFTHICEQLGVDVSEAIMIDDNADNIAGALVAGLYGIQYEGLAHLRRSLQALLPKL